MTAAQVELMGMWKDLLGCENVTLDDDFFGLGGDSVLMMTMLFRINEVFGVDVPIGALFESPTILQISTLIEKERAPTL